MSQQQNVTKKDTRTGIRKPQRFHVMIHNDDFTTMDFVVMVLSQVFFKTEEAAYQLMMKVHKEGQAIVGTYPFDIAASKARKARDMARENKYPLRFSLLPE